MVEDLIEATDLSTNRQVANTSETDSRIEELENTIMKITYGNKGKEDFKNVFQQPEKSEQKMSQF